MTSGLYARFATSAGTFVVRLFEKDTPKTVANFVGLAEGTKAWKDPVTGESRSTPFYNGLIFHRVIADFMIQGGCPNGNGMGGPGYKFEDEFVPTLKHTKAGILSMANAGPNTNGSQFFITLVPTPWLDNRHSVFGEVVEGMDVITAIGTTKTGRQDRPATDITIDALTIERVA
jgi:peptidyl-prolyl cis-trans isomerase A (cyclophilin A)